MSHSLTIQHSARRGLLVLAIVATRLQADDNAFFETKIRPILVERYLLFYAEAISRNLAGYSSDRVC